MKKIFISIVLLLIISYSQAQKKDPFGKMYFNLGVSVPKGSFAKTDLGIYSKNGNIVPLFDLEKSGFAKLGPAVEFGMFGYFAKEDWLAIGINGAFGFSVNFFNKDKFLDQTIAPKEDSYFNPYYFGEFKIGPMVSFNIYKELVLDLFVRANGSLSLGPEIGLGYDVYKYNRGYGVGPEFGCFIRYTKILAGFTFENDEITFSKTKVSIQTPKLEAEPDIDLKPETKTIRFFIGFPL